MGKHNRRKFIFDSLSLSFMALAYPLSSKSTTPYYKGQLGDNNTPAVISTWDFGLKANEEAWKIMSSGGNVLDAVENGIRLIEADPGNLSVGYGGLPDRDGYVTLDASIMAGDLSAGSVTFLQNIMHPISVARLVMEKTPHVMLSGDGALQFALENGFRKEDLLTQASKEAWEKWKTTSNYHPVINMENHDTIGLLAIDENGVIAGGCSTSGLAYKMHGRVGDSPIIGAGLYVDGSVGAAVATGLGEAVMKNLSTFLVVELMREGAKPQEACEEAIKRIVKANAGKDDFQVGLIALRTDGLTGGYSIHPGFRYALSTSDHHELIPSLSYIR